MNTTESKLGNMDPATELSSQELVTPLATKAPGIKGYLSNLKKTIVQNPWTLRAVAAANILPLVASGCAPEAKGTDSIQPTSEPTRTTAAAPSVTAESPRLTATAIPRGANIPITGDARIDAITERLVNPSTKPSVPEQDIIDWNSAMLAIDASVNATATAEAQKPEPTKAPAIPTAEIEKNIPCEILPKEYCGKVDLILQETPAGIMNILGVKLPKEVPIRAKKGQVQKTELGADVAFFRGFRATIFNPENPNKLRYKITGDFKPNDMITSNMEDGDIIGYSQDTGIDMLGYNLIIYAYDIDEKTRKEVINVAAMQKDFPEAYAKPPKRAVYEGPAKNGTVNNTAFYPKKPE